MSDRRNFLKTGALATGGMLLVPLTVSATENIVESTEDKRKSSSMRKLGSGKHSLSVSSVSLGCMGMSYHRSFIPDPKTMENLLRTAVDLGQNHFDTAEAYGSQTNEVLVGKALKSIRKKIIIATKFGFKNGHPYDAPQAYYSGGGTIFKKSANRLY